MYELKIKPIPTSARHGKRLFSVDAASFAAIVNLIPKTQSFGLLLACDARNLSAETISKVAKAMYTRGLCYLCTWGPDCERVHDIFDETGVEIDAFAMTTWHDHEPVEDVVWFFLFGAIAEQSGPTKIDDADWIAVSVANQDWLQKIEVALCNPQI
jgi:RsiW-degrading membrane proteinase PrsW (M82 family)